MSHTPGPWRVVDSGAWDISVVADGTVCHINNHGEWFPKGQDTMAGRNHNRMLSDARLIAAAPDLLAACQSALMWLLFEGYPEDNAHVTRCADAIRKATGSDHSVAE